MKNWKIYELFLKPYETFSFYLLDGKATLINDPEHSIPGTNTYWDSEHKKHVQKG